MKKNHLIALVYLSLLTVLCSAQSQRAIDLHKLVKDKGITVVNRELSVIEEDSRLGIRLSKEEGEGLAWLKDIEFGNGIIEFDVRGEDVKQHSFVGIAFHGQNDSVYDAIYLRPFQFRANEDSLKKRAIQYISLPEFTWRKLRAKFPRKYEQSIDPAPDPNSWIRVVIVINGETVSTYINGAKEPNLVVKKVTNTAKGRLGFYVADTSGGDFANISITKTD